MATGETHRLLAGEERDRLLPNLVIAEADTPTESTWAAGSCASRQERDTRRVTSR